MRFLLSLFRCAHRDTFRERRGKAQQIHAVCHRCGHAEILVSRTAGELRQFKRLRPASESMKAQPSSPGRLLAMRGRAK